MGKDRLNNFILWCKGWYVSTKDMDMITQARKVLQLDDYLACNNPISIALIYIDELVEKRVIDPINLYMWNSEITKFMNLYGMNYNEAVLFQIKTYFGFFIKELHLNPPIYSRKVYKLGFKAPSQFGNSYTLANYKVKKYFNKK